MYFLWIKKGHKLYTMLISCIRCGTIHAAGQCKIKKPYRKKESTEITRFRSSAIWTATRKQILQRDGYACKLCAKHGRINAYNLQVHHIEPLTENFERRTDSGNLITLCERCHANAHSYGGATREELYILTGKSISDLIKLSIPPVQN